MEDGDATSEGCRTRAHRPGRGTGARWTWARRPRHANRICLQEVRRLELRLGGYGRRAPPQAREELHRWPRVRSSARALRVRDLSSPPRVGGEPHPCPGGAPIAAEELTPRVGEARGTGKGCASSDGGLTVEGSADAGREQPRQTVNRWERRYTMDRKGNKTMNRFSP
jgi:hypothetical protein